LPPFDSPIGGFAIVETLVAAVAARLGDAGRTRIQEIEQLNVGWIWDDAAADEVSRMTLLSSDGQAAVKEARTVKR
jgi:hypothetical protein